MKKTALSALCLASLLATSCVGHREANNRFTVHAESFRLFGFAIPSDDQDAATKMVDEKFPGAEIISQSSSPADWNSIVGALNNIIGFSTTQISGKKK